MGALSDQMMRAGFALVQTIHGSQIKIISGAEEGNLYTGTILVIPSVVFDAEVTTDPREKSVIHFPDTSWPQQVKPGDQMQDSDGQKWKFGKRINNPADTTVDFEVIKIVAGKDE